MSESDFFVLLLHEAKRRGVVAGRTVFGPKSMFWYHVWINALLNIVYPPSKKDTYLSNYWTTIRYSVAAPDQKEPFTQWYILLHELCHVRQYMKWRILFPVLYLWPLSQGIVLIFTCWLPVFWSSGWPLFFWIIGWLVIGGLHFIPQLPDPWRVWWELQAYTISLFLFHQRNGRITTTYIDHIVDQFTGMAYYQMAIRRGWMVSKLIEISKEISEGTHPVKNDPLVLLVVELRQKYVIG